ncbi:uncharacterized protein PAC_09836 [Phialocephala subalpina]|uniref:Uncharacterized protein n=1 Tax=Phialocephala subalpina TaxID=576137 RepID=A0A1L7X4I7_9HELO|nr:uncharacterized protein PAC_09836 [Phialocephala subalpina]
MDSEFLSNLLPEESDFLDPNSLSGPATKSCDSFGPNHNQCHDNVYGCMTTVDGDPLSCPLSWKKSIIRSDVDPTMSDGWPLYNTVYSNPSLTNFDTNHQLPFLLHSELDSDLSLFDPPNTQEQDRHLQNGTFLLGSSSMSMAEDTLLDPLRSFYKDSPLDEYSSSQVIYTPTSSGASYNSNIGTTEQNFSEPLWSNIHPELEDIEYPLGCHPQQSHEIQQNEFSNSNPTESTSTYIILLSERLSFSSTVLGSHPLLPPPEQLMTTFESKHPKTTVSKGKKAYTVEGRKKVGQVRKIGACWQCQIRKIACSADETCIYEMIIKSQEHNNGAIRFLSDIMEQVSFRLEAMIDDYPTLTLTVTPYERIYPGLGLSGSYSTPVSWHPPARECRAILPDSVPNVEQLENMSRPGTCKVHDPFLNHDLHDKIDYMLLLCSKRRLHQPLHELVAATLRVVNLRSFLMHSLVYTNSDASGSTSPNPSYADPVLNQHIRAIALAGIAKAEKFIISQFNDLSRLIGLDSCSLMVAKICLLRLLLVYRNDVLLCARSMKIPVKSRVIFATRLEKVKFMYRVAATTYGILCERTSSFTPFEWSYNVQQNDPVQSGDTSLLAAAIKELNTAYINFCEQELSQKYDEVFLLFIKGLSEKEGRRPWNKMLSGNNKKRL